MCRTSRIPGTYMIQKASVKPTTTGDSRTAVGTMDNLGVFLDLIGLKGFNFEVPLTPPPICMAA